MEKGLVEGNKVQTPGWPLLETTFPSPHPSRLPPPPFTHTLSKLFVAVVDAAVDDPFVDEPFFLFSFSGQFNGKEKKVPLSMLK